MVNMVGFNKKADVHQLSPATLVMILFSLILAIALFVFIQYYLKNRLGI